MRERYQSILGEIAELLRRSDPADVDRLYEAIMAAPRVMAYATGRSGFLLRTFIMRLNHLGREAYFVGEASTPPVRAGDAFLVLSGSGSTATTLGAAREAVSIGARPLAILGTRRSPIGRLAEVSVVLPAPHKRGVAAEGQSSGQTAGSLFEQAAFVVLESLILRRFEESGKATRAALARHANLEA